MCNFDLKSWRGTNVLGIKTLTVFKIVENNVKVVHILEIPVSHTKWFEINIRERIKFLIYFKRNSLLEGIKLK